MNNTKGNDANTTQCNEYAEIANVISENVASDMTVNVEDLLDMISDKLSTVIGEDASTALTDSLGGELYVVCRDFLKRELPHCIKEYVEENK